MMNENQMSEIIMNSKSCSILQKLQERIELKNRYQTLLKEVSSSDYLYPANANQNQKSKLKRYNINDIHTINNNNDIQCKSSYTNIDTLPNLKNQNRKLKT